MVGDGMDLGGMDEVVSALRLARDEERLAGGGAG